MAELEDPGAEVDVDVGEVRPFMRELFDQQAAEDLYRWIDDRGLTGELYETLERLAVRAGGEVTAPVATSENRTKLGILIGKRRHLKLKQLAWKLVMEALPVLVRLLSEAGSSPTTIAELIGALAAVTDSLERLDPEEWQAYMVVKKLTVEAAGPAGRQEVMKRLHLAPAGEKLAASEMKRVVDRMVEKGVLEESSRGLTPVF